MIHSWKVKVLLIVSGFVFIAITAPEYAFSQQDNISGYHYTLLDRPYIESYFTDFDDFLTRPLKWDQRQWIGAAIITAAGIGLYVKEEAVHSFFIANTSNTLAEIDKWFLDPLGIGILAAPVIGAMYFTGNERAKGTALTVVKAYGYGMFTAGSLKYLFQRARPSHLNPSNPYHWEGFWGSWKHNAFPSGHSTLSFAMATVIASEYNDVIWVPVVCYSLAAMASLSRIQHGDHWPGDALIGAALGYGIGKFMHQTSKKTREKPVVDFN
jgi:membrane-associated phospholipid phosphatase